jgi:serine/threonine protein kinase/Tfp pilus assembly protein PilF
VDADNTESIGFDFIASRDRVISHYRMIEPIGRGGMGMVWKAEDLRLRRTVALKFIRQGVAITPEARSRFETEAQACAALDHPAVCSIFDIGDSDGVTFLVMPYIDGETLAQKVRKGPLSPDESLRIVYQIAQGLEAAHTRNVIHRDIKSSNVMIDRSGQVKVLDFGVARVSWAGLTPDALVGTPQYMSPEQISDGDVDVRTDLWSLGIVFYEMLTGRLPYSGVTREELFQAILYQPLGAVNVGGEPLPRDLDSVLRRLLAKNRQDRFSSAAELVTSLQTMMGRRSGSSTDPRGADSKSVPDRLPSLAVLPFANISADPENEYFSDGLTDELINGLSRLHGLRVMSRTSAFAMKGTAEDARRIGEILGVDAVLEGSVRRAENRLRINVQLVSTTDGSQIWSQRYDRELQDVFAIQEDIATRVVASLKATLLNRAMSVFAHYKASVRTYDYYLQGSYYLRQMSPVNLEVARGYFESALQEDPNYGPAHAGMGYYYYQLAFYNMVPPREALSTARGHVMKSLELDGSLAESHRILGEIIMDLEWDWSGAEEESRTAIELSPGQASIRYSYMLLLMKLGRFEEARHQLDTALEYDPVAPYLNAALAGLYYYQRDYDQALDAARRTLQLDPNHFEVHLILGLTHIQQSNFVAAISAFEKTAELSGGHPLALASLAYAFAMAQRSVDSRALLGQLVQLASQIYVSPGYISVIYVGLGEPDEAFAWLDKASEARDPMLTFLGVAPVFDPLRADSRFDALLARVGLPEYPAASRAQAR